jgi:hypothetical protein
VDTPNWPTGVSFWETLLSADLDEEKRLFFGQVRAIEGGCALLRYLDEHPRVQLTAEDIAFHAQEAPERAEKGLHALANLGVLRQTEAAGVRFYGLSLDPGQRRRVDDLLNWQRHWHTRLARIRSLVDG